MKKVILLGLICSFAMISCKKEDAVKPTSACPEYSVTDYYIINGTSSGEVDTIRFDFASQLILTGLSDQVTEPLPIQSGGTGGNDFFIPVDTNSAGNRIIDGWGQFNTSSGTVTIIWRIGNTDGSNSEFFNSVYSKCKIN